jgi:hypothetical protein
MDIPPNLDTPDHMSRPPGMRGQGAWSLPSEFSTVLTTSASIISAIQRVKVNRTEALNLGRRVQVLMDIIEPLRSDCARIDDLFGQDAARKLCECLGRCAEAVGVQTNRRVWGRVIRVQSDASTLVALSKELNECAQLLGFDIQSHENRSDVRGSRTLLFFGFNVKNNAANLRSQRPNYSSEYQQA